MAASLTERFSSKLAPSQRSAVKSSDDLERKLGALWEAGQRAWPTVDLPADALMEAAARRVGTGPDVQLALESLRPAELYLAAACECGLPSALAILEGWVREDAQRWLRRNPRSTVGVDDARQQLLEHLLVPARPGAPTRLASFAGTGSFQGFVRIALTRLLLNVTTRAVDVHAAMLSYANVPGLEPPPDARVATAELRVALAAAFPLAVAALPIRSRNLLKHRYLDGSTVEEIAVIYGIHRVTATRQLARARADLMAGIKAELSRRLALDSEGVRSVVRAVRSHIDLNLSALFPTPNSRT